MCLFHERLSHRCKLGGYFGWSIATAPARYRRTDKAFSYDPSTDFAAAGRPGYDRAETALAWNRTVAFMRANLGKPPA